MGCCFGRPSSGRPYDPLGTPLPDTPSTSRAPRVGYGSLGGLEREPSGRGGKQERGKERKPLLGLGPEPPARRGASPGQLTDKYVLKEVLGVGSTSTCHRCLSISTSRAYACKVIDKRHIEQRFRGLLEQFNVEIDALRELRHPGIIELEDVYVTPEKIYMVMELMGGGELFDYVVEKGTLTEEEASRIVNKVTSAVV
ncbi:hypothetical protein TeGR_g8276, partial [Tetraparma gracilis]